MGLFRDVGHWAVTTADDAHGEANGLDPADAKPEDPVWAVYDPNEDDEPVAENLTHFWAMRVATALHLMDVVAPVLGALESEPMPAQPDPYDEVGAKGYFVVCCKACDSGRVAPVPFANEESRTGWIREHTLGTGHTHYHLVNPTPHQAKIVAVDAPPNILPPGFALAGEVSLGAVTAGPSATDLVEDE